jgi:CBS domain-containing protein
MQRHKSQVQDLMTENPFVVEPETSLLDAYTLMFEKEIRRLPVVRGKKLVGIITLSDIQRALPSAFEEAGPDTQLKITSLTVGDVMTADPVTVVPEDTIQEVAEQMLENQVSGLPVVQNERVIGIITESDIFKFIVSSWSESP